MDANTKLILFVGLGVAGGAWLGYRMGKSAPALPTPTSDAKTASTAPSEPSIEADLALVTADAAWTDRVGRYLTGLLDKLNAPAGETPWARATAYLASQNIQWGRASNGGTRTSQAYPSMNAMYVDMVIAVRRQLGITS